MVDDARDRKEGPTPSDHVWHSMSTGDTVASLNSDFEMGLDDAGGQGQAGKLRPK